MELKNYKIGDLAHVTRGASLGGEFYATQGNYVRLTCGNFDYRNNCFKENQSKDNIYYTGGFKEEFLLEKGDIITPLTEQAIGLLGSTARIPESGKYIQSQDIAKIDCNESLLDKDFAFYLISSACVKQQLSAAAQQTKIRHTSPDKIKECTVWIPSLDVQKRIGRILTDIDNKIAINRQINDNLEAMAKQLYDYWFVQFDFPNEEGKPYKSSGGAMVWNEKLKRKIPNGWTVETVGTYANCKSGYAIKSSDFKAKGIPVIKIGNIQEDYTLNMNGCQYIENNTNKLFYVYQNDVVIAMTGATIGKFAIVPFSETGYFVNQRVGKFEFGNNPIKKMPYLINSLKIDYFRSQIFQLASGCAQPNISVEQINNISLLYPSTKILSEYNMKCKWMYEQIANCRYQIDVLTKLRDKLLPLLMNGQALVNYHLSEEMKTLTIIIREI